MRKVTGKHTSNSKFHYEQNTSRRDEQDHRFPPASCHPRGAARSRWVPLGADGPHQMRSERGGPGRGVQHPRDGDTQKSRHSQLGVGQRDRSLPADGTVCRAHQGDDQASRRDGGPTAGATWRRADRGLGTAPLPGAKRKLKEF